MKQHIHVEYIGVFAIAFIVSFLAITKGMQYLHQLGYREDTEVAAMTDVATASTEIPQDMNNQALLDSYATHLVTLNDPNKGCGCPACCGTI